MALVSCPECQHEVSSLAIACPQCAYPHPGQQGVTSEKLHSCMECGGVISKKAQSCPHCGVTCHAATENAPGSESSGDESWLCTHCGTPYTRKASKPAARISQTNDQQSKDQQPPGTQEQDIPKPDAPIAQANNQQSPEQIPPVSQEQEIPKLAPRPSHVEKQPSGDHQPPISRENEVSFLQQMGAAAPASGRHHSPLWFPSSPTQNLNSSHSRPRGKITLIVCIVFVLLLALSIFLWVLWEPSGTNPFDMFTIPTQSMTDSVPMEPQSGP